MLLLTSDHIICCLFVVIIYTVFPQSVAKDFVHLICHFNPHHSTISSYILCTCCQTTEVGDSVIGMLFARFPLLISD